MPYTLNGVLHAATVAADAGIAKTGTIGVVGQTYLTLFDKRYTPTGVGATSRFIVEVDNPTGITTGQRAIGVGIATGAKVIGLQNVGGTDNVILDKANYGAVSGIVTFFVNQTENVALGMGVTHSFLPGQDNSIPSGTVVTGIDERNRTIYISNALTNNIQAATGDTVTFNASKVTATNHGLVAGDVIYISGGTSATGITSSTYTVFSVPTTSTFTTVPALAGVGSATLYSSIMFAEKFTNGPYNIQNNGDQIKVTLNISLD